MKQEKAIRWLTDNGVDVEAMSMLISALRLGVGLYIALHRTQPEAQVSIETIAGFDLGLHGIKTAAAVIAWNYGIGHGLSITPMSRRSFKALDLRLAHWADAATAVHKNPRDDNALKAVELDNFLYKLKIS